MVSVSALFSLISLLLFPDDDACMEIIGVRMGTSVTTTKRKISFLYTFSSAIPAGPLFAM